ncbi:hypothetical protein Sjap_000641 [Stephania japonica]|uniref:Oil body-associated protein 2A n=1 Tax=Stephania japonica TaxID=461633 RepID=A0AAP0PU89_9MAGN
MASSDETPGPMPRSGGGSTDAACTPGRAMGIGQRMMDKGAQMLQSLKPVRETQQHVCTFALYSHDFTRQIETHHYLTRLNQDFLQCPVFDSDSPTARLIGIEYIVSERIFEALPPDEQMLWHSHAFEIKSGLWTNPRVPGMIQKVELKNLVTSYGKFWCTWQVDRGDPLPLGAPCLMMSPRSENFAMMKTELIKTRDAKYGFSREEIKESRAGISEPDTTNPQADYWIRAGRGFALDVEPVDMKVRAALP